VKLEQAMALAQRFHAGATDKAGQPYIDHVLRVAEAVESHDEKLAALMHDLLEDTVLTSTDLRCAGCPHRIVVAVDALTRRAGESYSDFVIRASRDPVARAVKLADLADNSDEGRLEILEPKVAQQLRKKYDSARVLLEATVPLDDIQREAAWASENGVSAGAVQLGESQGTELAYATFWCAVADCGRPAGTLTLDQSVNPQIPSGSAYKLTVSTFLGQETVQLGSNERIAVREALESADAEELDRRQEELVPFWCRICRRSYCNEHWVEETVFDDGFFDCIKGTCPNGHRWTLWD